MLTLKASRELSLEEDAIARIRVFVIKIRDVDIESVSCQKKKIIQFV